MTGAMLEKILVPLDGSKASLSVLPVVARLAAGANVELTLFTASHAEKATMARGQKSLGRAVPLVAMAGASVRGVIVPRPPAYAESRDQATERREHELLDYLSGVAAPLVEAGHRVELRVHFGDPVEEICRLASDGEFDLIAMATSNAGRTLHGSVPERVLHRGVAPVLIVNAKRRKAEGEACAGAGT
jgi:nucleotide-binding universal stress UspA family protein